MESNRQSRTVADRVPVDIEGLRERIAAVHLDNPLWSKLSLSQQIRQLIEDALEAGEQKPRQSKGSKVL